MTAPPSPVPHPLDEFPFDEPRWAHQALEWVIGSGWPAGDEAATWDVADRWYALATDLAGPHDAAHAAATRIVEGYFGAGIAADGFLDAWHRLSGDENAPLNALLQIAQELGALVEECGRDIEAAKLEVWIEIGTFLIELRGLALTAALTMGATAPAAGGLIAATRIAIQQIFDRLAEQLGTKPITQPAAAESPSHPEQDASSWPEHGTSSPRPDRAMLSGEKQGAPDRSIRDSPGRPRPETLAGPGGQTVAPPTPAPPTHALPVPAPLPVDRVRQAYAENQREDYLGYLATLADESRAKIRELEEGADRAVQVGAGPRGVALRRQATQIGPIVAEIEDRITLIRSTDLASRATADLPGERDSGRGGPNQNTSARDPANRVGSGGWARVGADGGGPTAGGVHSDDRSALTQTGGGRPIDQTRHYHVPGGLRRPSAVHQTALEEAMPPAGDGRVARLADPRVGDWFGLVNDGGPGADPTRGLNCLDAVLALFDTYLHARPRVAAPRTFDGYAQGDPDRAWGGEWDALERVRLATGATFQNLCPFVGAADPALAKPAVDTAVTNLTNHLHNSGHGAYAFLLTDLEGGGCHAWAAVNQGGTILFLDPQVGRISAEVPLYTHRGRPAHANVVSMDALVVDGQGVPAPLPYHGPGQWAEVTDPA